MVATAYCPPKHNNKEELYWKFLISIGNRLVIGGDYNVKHTEWELKLITTKGRELVNTCKQLNCNMISTRKSIYWYRLMWIKYWNWLTLYIRI